VCQRLQSKHQGKSQGGFLQTSGQVSHHS
jgi:hypothetical protein